MSYPSPVTTICILPWTSLPRLFSGVAGHCVPKRSPNTTRHIWAHYVHPGELATEQGESRECKPSTVTPCCNPPQGPQRIVRQCRQHHLPWCNCGQQPPLIRRVSNCEVDDNPLQLIHAELLPCPALDKVVISLPQYPGAPAELLNLSYSLTDEYFEEPRSCPAREKEQASQQRPPNSYQLPTAVTAKSQQLCRGLQLL